MRAGLLTETITVKTPTTTTNSVGEQSTTYTDKATIKARNVINRQTRTNDNGDVWLPATHTLEVRMYQNISDYDIISWNGKIYHILSIEIDRPRMCKRLEIAEINETAIDEIPTIEEIPTDE